eukprot:scaffold109066_cov18-Tisochrysis_lutea.AAC.1
MALWLKNSSCGTATTIAAICVTRKEENNRDKASTRRNKNGTTACGIASSPPLEGSREHSLPAKAE